MVFFYPDIIPRFSEEFLSIRRGFGRKDQVSGVTLRLGGKKSKKRNEKKEQRDYLEVRDSLFLHLKIWWVPYDCHLTTHFVTLSSNKATTSRPSIDYLEKVGYLTSTIRKTPTHHLLLVSTGLVPIWTPHSRITPSHPSVSYSSTMPFTSPSYLYDRVYSLQAMSKSLQPPSGGCCWKSLHTCSLGCLSRT